MLEKWSGQLQPPPSPGNSPTGQPGCENHGSLGTKYEEGEVESEVFPLLFLGNETAPKAYVKEKLSSSKFHRLAFGSSHTF